MSSKIERAFEKQQNMFFNLHFANSNFNIIFFALFLKHQTEIISYLEYTHNLCDEQVFFLYIHDCHKRGKNQFFLKKT